MKIIKPGKFPEDKLRRMTCRSCKCVFEALESEATKLLIPNGNALTYFCPHKGCGKRVDSYA